MPKNLTNHTNEKKKKEKKETTFQIKNTSSKYFTNKMIEDVFVFIRGNGEKGIEYLL
jgi:hypothetical protein